MIRAGDIMTQKVISVSKDTSIEDLCGLLHEGRITGAPVIDSDGMLVGIVSKDDVVGAYFRERGGAESAGMQSLLGMSRGEDEGPATVKSAQTVEDIMTVEVVTATEETPVDELCDLMVTKGIHRIPVVREGKVVGIVSTINVLEAFLEDKLST